MYIRSAELEEDCKYVLIDDGSIVKKYYEQDEPVNFTVEVEKALQEKELITEKQRIIDLEMAMASLLGGA